MIWAGRPGMWDDLAFQKKAKKNENKGKEKNAKKAYCTNGLYIILLCGLADVPLISHSDYT